MGCYFQGPSRWTKDPEQAYDFHFVDRALQYMKTWGLTEVELVFSNPVPITTATVAVDKSAVRCVS